MGFGSLKGRFCFLVVLGWGSFYLLEDVVELLVDRFLHRMNGSMSLDEIFAYLELFFDIRSDYDIIMLYIIGCRCLRSRLRFSALWI